MNQREIQLAECLKLLEETGDMDRSLALHPHLKDDLEAFAQTMGLLSTAKPAHAAALSQTASRQQLLSTLQLLSSRRFPFVGGLLTRTGAAIAVLGLLFAGAVGVSASTGGLAGLGPVSDVLSAVGLVSDSPGAAVSNDVEKAIDDSVPGPGRGKAVSEAACAAAHDADRLPDQATNPPGPDGKELPDAVATARARQSEGDSKDCTLPNADATSGVDGEPATKPQKQQSEHGKPAEPGKPTAAPSQSPSSTPPGQSN